METYHILFSVMSAIILFLFGLSAFSTELRQSAGNKLKVIMNHLTSNRFYAFCVGAIFTTIIQSSTAVTALAVSLVDSKVLSFAGAIAIMLGAYVGTTTTAWLVSFKLTGIGPFFIVIGAIISTLPFKIKVFGKALFYFGFIFFSLDLVSNSLEPLKSNQDLLYMLTLSSNPFVGILMGILLTLILQSSTIVTGLAIIFVQQSILLPENSISIVLGANIGTTATAFIASLGMSITAKKAAVSNTLINIIGVILFLPILNIFTNWVISIAPTPSMVVAITHLSFNVALVTVFMIFLNPFIKFMDTLFSRYQKVSHEP